MMNQYQEIAAVIACFALLCTVLTLLIITRMKWNGFILLLTSLSISQFIFDFSFLFFFMYGYSWYYSIFLYVYIFGELTVALWTNLITLLTFRIVYGLKTVNIYQEYPYYLFIDLSVPVILVIYSASLHQLNIDILNDAFRVFYWFRLMSVIFNVIFFGITQYFVNVLRTQIINGKLSAVQAQAITVMVSRMKYYSVVQVCLILPGCIHAWNKWTLQDPVTNYIYFSTAPMCGIGYFLVFLNMQPTAMKIFLKYLFKWFPCLKSVIVWKGETVDAVLNKNNENVVRDSEMMSAKLSESHLSSMSDEDLAQTIDQSRKEGMTVELQSKSRGIGKMNSIQKMKEKEKEKTVKEERDSYDSFDDEDDEDDLYGEGTTSQATSGAATAVGVSSGAAATAAVSTNGANGASVGVTTTSALHVDQV